MSNLTLTKSRFSLEKVHLCNPCLSDNITIVPKSRNDSMLCLSRCNYCGKEWNELWLSYRNIFVSSIYKHRFKQLKDESVSTWESCLPITFRPVKQEQNIVKLSLDEILFHHHELGEYGLTPSSYVQSQPRLTLLKFPEVICQLYSYAI
jgi:hypothetical protein